MIELLLILFVVLLNLHYLNFLLKILTGLTKLQSSSNTAIPDEFVSIIIPFRNEEENILHTLKSLENQNYPEDKFEVIFIDDDSTDKSLEILEKNISKKNIKALKVPKSFSVGAHKKRAIRFGIENSKGEIIVTTDADCTHPKSWLKTLLSFMDSETGFVSGPVEFSRENNFFSRIQALEFAGLVLTGAGLIGYGSPIICNAANIAYRKKAYNLVNGFTYQMNLSSGDDELLMQKIFRDTSYNIKFVLSRDAVVKTAANKNLKDFYQQRKRWASKGLFYKNRALILKLILIYLFYLSIPIQLVLGIFQNSIFLISFVFSLSTKFLVEFIIIKKGTKLLFDEEIYRPFLIAEFFQIPYIIIAGISGALGNFNWKGRKLRR